MARTADRHHTTYFSHDCSLPLISCYLPKQFGGLQVDGGVVAGGGGAIRQSGVDGVLVHSTGKVLETDVENMPRSRRGVMLQSKLTKSLKLASMGNVYSCSQSKRGRFNARPCIDQRQ